MIDANVLRSNWPHLAAYADEIDRLRADLEALVAAGQAESERLKAANTKFHHQLTDAWTEVDGLKAERDEARAALTTARDERSAALEQMEKWAESSRAAMMELERTRKERDAERDSNEQGKEILANVYASHDAWAARAKTAESALATARSLMAEEAARWADTLGSLTGAAVAASIRALAPLDPGLVAVPVETLDELRSFIQSIKYDETQSDRELGLKCDAALALLPVKP